MLPQGSVKKNLGAKAIDPGTQAFGVVSTHELGVELGQFRRYLHA